MSEKTDIARHILPIPERPHTGLTTYNAKDPDTSYPPIRDLRPPDGAPNVLVILIDLVGFGASSAFGSPVTDDYPVDKKFSGEVNWVEIDVDKDAEDLDHLISPEQRLHVAMALQ